MMTPEILLQQLDTLKKDRDQLIQSFKSVIKSTFVEKFNQGYERPCEEHDFSGSKSHREAQIKNVKSIFHHLVSTSFFYENVEGARNIHPDMDNQLLALLLILCGENLSVQPWNNKTMVSTCQELLFSVLNLFSCKDVSNLISRDHKINMIKDIMQILCPNLLATKWKLYPGSVVCYKWILENIRQPELSSHLPIMLPTALLLVDDFVNENKITGVMCLSHIVQNVTIAELQFCGHGDVIYNALLPLLRIREADLISVTVPCLVYLTTKLEVDFGKKDAVKWSKFDDVLEIYLENMELESLIDLRSSFISHLELILRATKFGTVRWTQRLLRIFKEYLEVAGQHSDSKSRNHCLKAVETFIEYSKSVTPIYAENLLYALLVALRSDPEGPTEAENREIAVRCIKKLLESISETEKEKIKVDLQTNLGSDEYFSNFYKQVCDVLQL